jgi:hypothetical protein
MRKDLTEETRAYNDLIDSWHAIDEARYEAGTGL